MMPPNGMRLSCGAELECSQTEFYYTACKTFSGVSGDGRRQLQALVRRRAQPFARIILKGLSANNYCTLDQDPLWLCSEIKSVRSAVKPNSAETCPIEAQRDDALTSYLIVGTGALNATHIEQRHIRHKTANRQTILPRLTNTPPRKCGDLDGKWLVPANGVWDDYCSGIASRNQSRRHGIGSLGVQGRSAPAGQDSENTETCSVRCRTASCGGGGHGFERADQFTRSPGYI